MKTVCRLHQNLKIELPHDPEIPLLSIYLNIEKTLLEKIFAPLCSLQYYLQWPRYGCKLTVYQLDKWIKNMEHANI